MAVAAEGSLPGFAVSAIIGGGGAAVSTPTSSQLLGRVSPPRLAPLVFSIKQTSVPAGLLISGFLAPTVAGALGWRGAALITGVACVAFAAMLQPLRARFDDDRVPSRRFRLSDFRTTIASVLKAPDLRRLSFARFAFNGVQSVFTAYFVTYPVALGYELGAAGFLFSLVVAVAVPCRISASMGAWEDFLLQEILPAIERRFGCGGAGHRGVFGKSLGGYGAITYALRHSDIWAFAACHSGDMGFDLCYLPDMPEVLRTLA